MNLRTPTATKLVGALALVLVAAAAWMFVLGPKTSALFEVQSEIAAARDQSELLQQQLVSLREQQERLDELRADAQALATRFPATADQPGLFRQVTAAAAEAGIGAEGITSLAPSPPVVGGTDPATGAPLQAPETAVDLGRQTVTVAVEGTYDQTQRLLENLEQMPRAYLVQSLTLTGGGAEGAFTTTITGDMFVMPPVPDPAETPGSPRLVAR
jgi:hypothetical protein